MAKKEPGRFRKNIFGGFNRKDVLTYIKALYDELDQTQTENESLHQRCVDLESFVQNLEQAAWEPQIRPGPVVRAAAPPIPPPIQMPVYEPEPEPESYLEDAEEPELFSILASDPEPAPAPPPPPAPAPRPAPELAPRSKPALATPPAMQPANKSTKVKVRPI